MRRRSIRAIGWTLGTFVCVGCHAAFGSSFFSGNGCALKPKADYRIMLDVGHTPKEPGAISSRGLTEHDFNRQLVEHIAKELKSAGFHSTRVLEIVKPGKAGLRQRPAEANDWPANLLMSIHHDSVQRSYLRSWTYQGHRRYYSDNFRGFSIFVSRDNASHEASLRFAAMLADQLISRGMTFTTHHAEDIAGERRELLDPARGIYRFDRLTVLRFAKMPAVLLEAGVIVNRDEELLVASPPRRDAIAVAITAAVAEFCSPTSAP